MEIWKDFDEFYEVSSFGNIRSKGRYVYSTYGGKYWKEGRILKQNDNGNGYLQVQLCKNGKSKTERVHRLVALTFIENPLRLPQVNHKDFNKRNNNANNLEWCTLQQNVEHSKSANRMKKPQFAKLSEEAVLEIKYLISEQFSNREIAELFDVHPGTIQCIRIGRNWSHIK